MEVLNEQQLIRLGEHKYSASGTSILEPHFQVFWRWLVEFFPKWVAPNAITMAGLIVNIITSLLLMYYSPTAVETAPSWVYFSNAIGLFIYQSLDAIDGKQARRTNSSSPLGELFDHGCDSISTVFVSTATCCALLIGNNHDVFFFLCISSFFTFYFGHWVAYVTGKLQFGYIDVTEVQCGVMVLHMISGLFGPQCWNNIIPVLGVPLKVVPVVLTIVGCISTCLRFSAIIKMGGCGPNGSTTAGTSVVSPAVNIAVVIVFATIISKKSQISVYEYHPVLYVLFFGIIAAKVTNRLVVAHMTKSELNLLDTSLLGPCLLFLNQYFNSFINEYFLLWVCMVHACVDLTQYMMYTFQQIAAHLGIHIFTIKYVEEEDVTKSK